MNIIGSNENKINRKDRQGFYAKCAKVIISRLYYAGFTMIWCARGLIQVLQII